MNKPTKFKDSRHSINHLELKVCDISVVWTHLRVIIINNNLQFIIFIINIINYMVKHVIILKQLRLY